MRLTHRITLLTLAAPLACLLAQPQTAPKGESQALPPPEDAAILRQRAATLAGAGKYAEAEPLLTHALELQEKELGSEDPGLTPVIAALESVYRAQGRNPEAEKLCLRSLAIKTKAANDSSPELIADLKALAGIYAAMQVPNEGSGVTSLRASHCPNGRPGWRSRWP